MLHLIKYNIIVKLKNFNVVFWPLFFPLILGTLFYFAFGQMEEGDFETVPVAIVSETDTDMVFIEFLKGIENSEDELIHTQEMSEDDALNALENHKISGIFYTGPDSVTDGQQKWSGRKYSPVSSGKLSKWKTDLNDDCRNSSGRHGTGCSANVRLQ